MLKMEEGGKVGGGGGIRENGFEICIMEEEEEK